MPYANKDLHVPALGYHVMHESAPQGYAAPGISYGMQPYGMMPVLATYQRVPQSQQASPCAYLPAPTPSYPLGNDYPLHQQAYVPVGISPINLRALGTPVQEPRAANHATPTSGG